MKVQSVINGSNSKTFGLERVAIALEVKLIKSRRLEQALWFVASISSGGLSKCIEIPCKLVFMIQDMLKQAILKMIRFRIADIYYCHVANHGHDVSLHKSKLLITHGEWIKQRGQLLNSKGEFFVIPFERDRIFGIIKDEISQHFRDLGIEVVITEILPTLFL